MTLVDVHTAAKNIEVSVRADPNAATGWNHLELEETYIGMGCRNVGEMKVLTADD